MAHPELSSIHRQYLSLSRMAREQFGGTLAGKLLLRTGFDGEGVAMVLAGSVARAAVLCVDRDAEGLRQGLRSGHCDFVVGHLDEALRILKNEVRRGRAVSVGLTVEPAGCLLAMADRGVQPDLVSSGEDTAHIFAERGAVVLNRDAEADAGSSLLCWSAMAEAARAMPQMARLAAEVLDRKREDTEARLRWLESSPRYLGRAYAGRQCVAMTDVEATALMERARAELPVVRIERADAGG